MAFTRRAHRQTILLTHIQDPQQFVDFENVKNYGMKTTPGFFILLMNLNQTITKFFLLLDRFYYMNVLGGERYSSHSREEGSYRYRGDVSCN